jgi:hypothetical protein
MESYLSVVLLKSDRKYNTEPAKINEWVFNYDMNFPNTLGWAIDYPNRALFSSDELVNMTLKYFLELLHKEDEMKRYKPDSAL